MIVGINYACRVTDISWKDPDPVISLRLDGVPIMIAAKTTKAAVDNLNLKKNDLAYADIFWWDPKEPPVPGNRMVTVFVQGNWVTIPLGSAAHPPVPEGEECIHKKETSPLTDAVAKKFGYPDKIEFLDAVNVSLNTFGRCPPGSIVKQIESVREDEHGWKWHTFRYGTTCRARICQMKEDSGSVFSVPQIDAWMHGYLSPDDYANERSNALTTADGSLDGPVLAGFCYTGPKKKPDPGMLFMGAPSYDPKKTDIFSVPVNLYRKAGTAAPAEKIGRITIENVTKE